MNKVHMQKIPRYLFGLGAFGLAGYFLLSRVHDQVIFFASLFLLIIITTDTLQSKIPNLATLSLVIIGFGYHLIATGMPGGATALTGMLAGLTLLLPFYLLGGVGAGDVKALAALGTLMGPVAIFQVFLFTGLIGGGMAMVHLALSDNLKKRLLAWSAIALQLAVNRQLPERSTLKTGTEDKYPYGSAIAFGFFAFISWGGLI